MLLRDGHSQVSVDRDGFFGCGERVRLTVQFRQGGAEVDQGVREVGAVPFGVGCGEFPADGDGVLLGQESVDRAVQRARHLP